METSPSKLVRELYDSSAASYAQMMDTEINLPVYGALLSRLQERLADLKGGVLDSSCGTGHLLELYHRSCDPQRALSGIDLSPAMVAHAKARLEQGAQIELGDMRDLDAVPSHSLAALFSLFAIHHLAPQEIPVTLQEWSRVLASGGQLVIATWEGRGTIDYGKSADIIALRYRQEELVPWLRDAGFTVDRSWVEDVEGFDMDALYLEATACGPVS